MWNSLIQGFFPEKMGTYYIPDEHLDDFVNHKKPEKNNRSRKIINQSQFRFIGKDYEFPYQKMRDELFANYKKKPPQVDSNNLKDGKKKWTNKMKQKSEVPQADSRQSLSVPQAKLQNSSDKEKQENPQNSSDKDKKFKKFPNKSK
jgi:hypothetical protein